ncbi:hypothetical protein DPMN_025708 [Dreissena polymorpha]|uniref:Uncharacterized protein n=1 Tax=Dreissena polymorpha TaxID=45954 RepID=A0A9D4LR82_DREPO|nr:hypothetical protein DPMN_025708 [Dreissena polymorpha]
MPARTFLSTYLIKPMNAKRHSHFSVSHDVLQWQATVTSVCPTMYCSGKPQSLQCVLRCIAVASHSHFSVSHDVLQWQATVTSVCPTMYCSGKPQSLQCVLRCIAVASHSHFSVSYDVLQWQATVTSVCPTMYCSGKFFCHDEMNHSNAWWKVETALKI